MRQCSLKKAKKADQGSIEARENVRIIAKQKFMQKSSKSAENPGGIQGKEKGTSRKIGLEGTNRNVKNIAKG